MHSTRFEYGFRVALHDVDAAGVMFFAHLFRHAHDAYEALMGAVGQPLDRLIRERRTLLPLVRAEADYRSPMRHGQDVIVDVCVAEIGTSSFRLHYRFSDGHGGTLATAQTVHAHLDPDRGSGTPLPAVLTAALSDRRCRGG
jgi:1,4-dihydroxy-2-naphthoyl-CoA hydrolase